MDSETEDHAKARHGSDEAAGSVHPGGTPAIEHGEHAGAGQVAAIDRPEAAEAPLGTFDIARIMRAIPHRYPFLLVDRIVDVKLEHSCVGIKNVTINEHFFQGHFPQEPVMPGVLIIECMAQTAAVLVVESLGPHAMGKLVYFMTIENAKFRKPVGPGDQLRVQVVRERKRGNVWKFNGEARVDGVLVAEANFGAMILDR